MKHQKIYNRLKRIEGQIRGICEMLNAERPEEDLLIQLEAARSAISSTIGSLIESMMAPSEDGKIALSEVQVRALLRSVKKS